MPTRKKKQLIKLKPTRTVVREENNLLFAGFVLLLCIFVPALMILLG